MPAIDLRRLDAMTRKHRANVTPVFGRMVDYLRQKDGCRNRKRNPLVHSVLNGISIERSSKGDQGVACLRRSLTQSRPAGKRFALVDPYDLVTSIQKSNVVGFVRNDVLERIEGIAVDTGTGEGELLVGQGRTEVNDREI